ncbi:MAG: TIGR01212 family radical SAM protein [Bacteroidales bacterium]|nr:TIGR01212 family radical SAM protein [Bacteroidales bacterium]
MYDWGHSRRFNAYSNYFKKAFGSRIQKVSIDAGFTCPNRDGNISVGGCKYCNNNSFKPSYATTANTIKEQIQKGIEFHNNRYKSPSKFLAYFQAYSNTYKPLNELKIIYSAATEFSEIAGFVIGTRPDCIDDEKLKYFKELSEKYYLIIEYGIESCNNSILKNINRGHTFEQASEAIIKTAEYGIKTGAHLIMGLPGESRDELLQSVNKISKLPLNNIKFHQLQIIRDTEFARNYKENPDNFNLFSSSEYIDFIINYIELLNPKFVIERFSGESPPQLKIAPDWNGIRSRDFLEILEKEMEKRNTWQGKLFIA